MAQHRIQWRAFIDCPCSQRVDGHTYVRKCVCVRVLPVRASVCALGEVLVQMCVRMHECRHVAYAGSIAFFVLYNAHIRKHCKPVLLSTSYTISGCLEIHITKCFIDSNLCFTENRCEFEIGVRKSPVVVITD